MIIIISWMGDALFLICAGKLYISLNIVIVKWLEYVLSIENGMKIRNNLQFLLGVLDK